MTPIVELRSVSIQFDAYPLFQKLSQRFYSQTVYGLIGPSGHGKSVLLKMMGGILQPSEGDVFLQSENLYQSPLHRKKELLRQVGMLFQRNALFDSMTVLENVEFPLRETTSLSDHEIRDWALHLLREVGLDHVIHHFPSQISGGMQKRLGVARALALKPRLIFYDDPTAGLDPITSRKIIDLILQLQKEQASTVITVTNDMNRAFQLSNQILMVVDGELIDAGSPQSIHFHSDARVQQFIRGKVHGPLTSEAQ